MEESREALLLGPSSTSPLKKFCPWHHPTLFHAMPDSLTRKHNFEMENISPKKVLPLGQQFPFTKKCLLGNPALSP